MTPEGSRTHAITLDVNGKREEHEVAPRLLLVHFLRETLGLTGTHVGCDTAQCGACTVLIDGQAAKSCSVLAVQVDKASITTIEGLGSADELHPIQQAFSDNHALQCGYCTPGFVMAAMQLIARHPDPDPDTIKHELEGNICRCTGYVTIIKAVQDAAQAMRGSGE